MSIAVKVGKTSEFSWLLDGFSQKKGDGLKPSPFFLLNFHVSLTIDFVQKTTFARRKSDKLFQLF